MGSIEGAEKGAEEGAKSISTQVYFTAKARNRRWARILMLVSVFVALLAASITMTTTVKLPWIVVSGLAVAAISAIIAGGVSAMRPRPRAARISLKDEGIAVLSPNREEQLLRREQIAEGYVEAPSRVVLRLHGGKEVSFDVPDAEFAEQALAIAGVSASARVMRVPLASIASRIPLGEIMGVFGFLFLSPIALYLGARLVALPMEVMAGTRPLASLLADQLDLVGWTLFLFGVIAALFRYMRIREVVVGTDSVVFHGFWGRRLLPYSAMRGVERHTHGVFLLLRNGKRLLLPIRARILAPLPRAPAAVRKALEAKGDIDENLVRRETLLLRIQQAVSSRGQSEGVKLALDRLDRRERPFNAWITELRELVAEKGGYRQGRVLADDLAVVVEDPGASPERRIGAAIALSREPDESIKTRIRIAVEACADEELQKALEEAAEGEIHEARLARLGKRYHS